MESNKVNIQDAVNQISELCNKLGVVLLGACNTEGIDAEIEVIPVNSFECERCKTLMVQRKINGNNINTYHKTTLPNEMIDYLPQCYAQIGNV